MTHDRLKHLISRLIEYNWDDEEEDYKLNPEGRGSHIFEAIVELDNYFYDRETKSSDFLEEDRSDEDGTE